MGLPFGLGDLDLKQFGTRLESADKTMALLNTSVQELTREVKNQTDQMRRFTNALEDALREIRTRS